MKVRETMRLEVLKLVMAYERKCPTVRHRTDLCDRYINWIISGDPDNQVEETDFYPKKV